MSGRLGVLAASSLALSAACAVTPLGNRIDAGNEPFVIGVGEGSDGNTDLFAASAGGGSFVQLTFTRAEERFPRLSPDGKAVAFFRRGAASGDSAWSVVVLDLKTMRERIAALAPRSTPERLGWTADGARVVALAGGYTEVDPVTGTAAAGTAAADSATREWLGTPPIARLLPCDSAGLCVVTRSGETTPLGAGVTAAIRWGADSLGYAMGTRWEVRPLAGGRSRGPEWKNPPRGLRGLTYHPGVPGATTAGPSGIR